VLNFGSGEFVEQQQGQIGSIGLGTGHRPMFFECPHNKNPFGKGSRCNSRGIVDTPRFSWSTVVIIGNPDSNWPSIFSLD